MGNRDYNREWMKRNRRRRKAFAVAYLGGVCRSCGSAGDLQFDHKDPVNKAFTVSKFLTVRWPVFLAELDKCQLLCRACHYLKTSRYNRTGKILKPSEIPGRANGVGEEDLRKGNYIEEDDEVF